MSKQQKNIAEQKLSEVNNSSELNRLVSLPPIAINEITHGDSLELTGCVSAKADLILEDMPYNTTNCDWDKEPIDLKRYWESRMELIKPTGVICLTASQPFTTILASSNLVMLKYEWIWEKTHPTQFAMVSKRPLKAHENILVFSYMQPTYNPQMRKGEPNHSMGAIVNGGEINSNSQIKTKAVQSQQSEMKYPKSVQKFANPREKDMHETQKPVGLFEYLIRTYTNEGDLVFDGFGGSGTTAVAAHKSKRNFIVIEKEKKYFDLAVRRLDIERAQYTML
ncbi:MAG: site-specific DNA-methyltransferase [Ignavibacterium sp.]|nr:site-specific DNA-methyltransferase [Ignavibacterium sp.]